MAPERSKPLHNFSLPQPKWGSQKILRYKKIPPNSDPSTLDHQSSLTKSSQFRAIPQIQIQNFKPVFNRATHNDRVVGETKMDAVRETDTIDLSLAKKIKVSIHEEGGEDESAAGVPWDLRTRRASCKSPQEVKRTELGSWPMTGKERTKFSISLSKEEVEEDFIAFFGTKPPRRPKKRPKILQKKLNSVFPGSRLTEVTLDSYKVPDVPKSFKGRRRWKI